MNAPPHTQQGRGHSELSGLLVLKPVCLLWLPKGPAGEVATPPTPCPLTRCGWCTRLARAPPPALPSSAPPPPGFRPAHPIPSSAPAPPTCSPKLRPTAPLS